MEALGASQALAERRQVLLDEPVMVVMAESGQRSVHVLAEEMAFVAPSVYGVDLVASDDATTCSIVLLISRDNVGIAHLDSTNQMAFFLKKWESLGDAETTQVAIIGGYDDEREIARPISMDILQTLMDSENAYELQQYVTGRWNTSQTDSGVMMPRSRGIGYFPAEEKFRQVEFESDARLPLVSLRFAGVSLHPLHTLMWCVEKGKPLEVTVGPYHGVLLSPDMCAYMLDLDDDKLLPKISTSPFAEGPKFLQDMREMLDFIINCSLRSLGNTVPSFVVNPYVQASAPSSSKIREILDREEASYESWRKSRKPVRLPHASLKLNNPLKAVVDSRRDLNRSRSTKALLAPPKSSGTGLSSSDIAGQNRNASNRFVKRKGALISGGLARSLEALPSLVDEHDVRQKQLQSSQGCDTSNRKSEDPSFPAVELRKATRKKFQRYLYDFHSRQVFSFAKSEAEDLEEAKKQENTEQILRSADENSGVSIREDNSSDKQSYFVENEVEDESLDGQNKYLLRGLGFLSGAGYDTVFEIHWRSSEAEKIVRDAVDRKRTREILRKAYRMLLWFFRYYAGKAAYAAATERLNGTGAVTALGEGLFEIPSRLRLLEDLNVQCVDSTRFGIIDTALKRESLIDFLINVARMMCTHSSNPNRLKMAINDGVEMSETVKTLIHEHFGVFAQVQDVDHFRTIFLGKSGGGGVHRRLHAILNVHKTNLANFFDELISVGTNVRSGGHIKGQQRQRTNGIVCTQFLSTLRAINLIPTRGSATLLSTDGEGSTGPAGVDEVRAVRIFLSCLPMATIEGTRSTAATTISNSTTSTEPRELTLSQFIEALLRVTFTWKELQICHGGFDVCPDQMTSERCRCTVDPTRYAFDVFDNAVEEIFDRIHTYRRKRAQHRTGMIMKTVGLKSHRSLHSLVAIATLQKAPRRLLPRDLDPINDDAES
ncbi:Protein N-terminal asparagine amidohydrolase [Phytophthora citrophthora]|uniref:Protein N-terminal asparagine amidohydrolase n=1 Tax=Phytophthora citrophthora TaxID=4793 RepID=A0AAD9GIQ0_9STRA|nr:Protein N-terminal asparagine amidohydrolase [Phytophthora citrophthora]